MARKGKRIGDGTSFAIKESFYHIKTKQYLETTNEMLDFINFHTTNRSFVDAMHTIIYDYVNKASGGTKNGDIKRLEIMVSEIRDMIKSGVAVSSETSEEQLEDEEEIVELEEQDDEMVLDQLGL